MSGALPLLGSSSSQAKCQICHKQAARYTCPNCNLRYCSLVCFRSEKHGDCSETFYKDSIINEVQGRNDVNPEEKTKVMDMLRRLQEADADDPEEEDSDADSESGLATALKDVDIDEMSPEELLAHLSPEQRKAFEEILRDPQKAAELLRDDKETHSEEFWWQQSPLTQDAGIRSDRKGKGRAMPDPLPASKLLAMTSQEELRLQYNLLAILMAYGLAHRLWADEDNLEEQQKTIARLLPFMTTKSTLLLKTAEEAANYVLSNMRSDLIQNRRQLLLLLLQDAEALLRVPAVSSEEEQNDKTLFALSDMQSLFAGPVPTKKLVFPLAGPKILFYASNLKRIPRTKLLHHVQRYRERLEAEEQDDSTLGEVAKEPLVLKPSKGRQQARPKIEEIA